MQAELGKKGWHTINSLCTACLKACTSKQKVTKFFRGNNLEEVKKPIQSQVRKSTSLSNKLKYIFCNSAFLHDFKTFNRGIIYWLHYSLQYNAAKSIFNLKIVPTHPDQCTLVLDVSLFNLKELSCNACK